MITKHKYNGGFWFRIFGRGFSIVNRKKNPPLFSLRYGYKKALWIRNYTVEWLSKRKESER